MAELTVDRLRHLLRYEPLTGDFVWLVSASNRAPAGSLAGSVDKARGYLTIRIDRHLYQAHRLAWLYTHGSWPVNEIDHRDTDRLNNRITNLRDVTFAMNQQNVRRPRAHNKSGYLGVLWDKRKKKWGAQLTLGGRCMRIGNFDDPADAHAAYVAAKRVLHPGNTL